jgi:hypothetical protein
MKGHLFVKAIIAERDDGGFYILLRNRLAKQLDFHIQHRFESREEAERFGNLFAGISNDTIHDLGSEISRSGLQSKS